MAQKEGEGGRGTYAAPTVRLCRCKQKNLLARFSFTVLPGAKLLTCIICVCFGPLPADMGQKSLNSSEIS